MALLFPGVMINWSDTYFLTSVYRNHSFTYTRWDSFCWGQQKFNQSLVHWALGICPQSVTMDALGNLAFVPRRNTLLNLKSLVWRSAQFIPCIDEVSTRVAKEISVNAKPCYLSANPRLVFSSQSLLRSVCSVLPPHRVSSVICNYKY